MSDTDRVYRLLRERGARGVHTHELRTMGYSGNPSQRAADIEAKYGVEVQRERKSRNGRPGSVYRIVGSSADPARRSSQEARGAGDNPHVSAASSEAVKRSVPSMFDPDVDWK